MSEGGDWFHYALSPVRYPRAPGQAVIDSQRIALLTFQPFLNPRHQIARYRDAPHLVPDLLQHVFLQPEMAGTAGAGLEMVPDSAHLFLAKLPIDVVVEPGDRFLAGQAVNLLRFHDASGAVRRETSP